MSTNYYAVCEKCLKEEEHYHRKHDNPVAHSYYGGIDKGRQVDIDSYLSPEETLIDEYGFLTTVAELRSKIGKGAKK